MGRGAGGEAEQVIGTAASWLKGVADGLELEEARETSVAAPPLTRGQRFNQAAQMAAKVAVGGIAAATAAAQLLPAGGGEGDTNPIARRLQAAGEISLQKHSGGRLSFGTFQGETVGPDRTSSSYLSINMI